MLHRSATLYCPVCDGSLGTHPMNKILIVTCNTKDCAIKWCYKPGAQPIALDYPGKPKSKICGCEGCKARDKA